MKRRALVMALAGGTFAVCFYGLGSVFGLASGLRMAVLSVVAAALWLLLMFAFRRVTGWP
jgi:hypothetical protein